MLYAFFALIATVTNIIAQDLFVRFYIGESSILFSVLFGTVMGLGVKYFLDKRYIFHFRATNSQHDIKMFATYTLMGLTTTVIFWGVEFCFHFLFGTKEMRYLGGVIGLVIGYVIKYHLDKRYVFVERNL